MLVKAIPPKNRLNLTLKSTTINIHHLLRNYYVVSIIYATIVGIKSADDVDGYG